MERGVDVQDDAERHEKCPYILKWEDNNDISKDLSYFAAFLRPPFWQLPFTCCGPSCAPSYLSFSLDGPAAKGLAVHYTTKHLLPWLTGSLAGRYCRRSDRLPAAQSWTYRFVTMGFVCSARTTSGTTMSLFNKQMRPIQERPNDEMPHGLISIVFLFLPQQPCGR